MNYNESLQPDAGTSIMTSDNYEMIELYQGFKREIWDRKGNPIYTECEFNDIIHAQKDIWYILGDNSLAFADFLAVKDMDSSIIPTKNREKVLMKVKYKNFYRSNSYTADDCKKLLDLFLSNDKENFESALMELYGKYSFRRKGERSDTVKFIDLLTDYLDKNDFLKLLNFISKPNAQVIIVESNLDMNKLLSTEYSLFSIKVPRYNSNKEARDRTVDIWRSSLCNKAKFSAEDYIISLENNLDSESVPSFLNYDESMEEDEERLAEFESLNEARKVADSESKFSDNEDVYFNDINDFILYRNFKSFSLDKLLLESIKKENLLKYFNSSEVSLARKLLIVSIKLYQLDKDIKDPRVKKLFNKYIELYVNNELFDTYDNKLNKNKKGWDSQLLVKYVFERSRLKSEGYVILDIFRNKLKKLLFNY